MGGGGTGGGGEGCGGGTGGGAPTHAYTGAHALERRAAAHHQPIRAVTYAHTLTQRHASAPAKRQRRNGVGRSGACAFSAIGGADRNTQVRSRLTTAGNSAGTTITALVAA